MATFFEILEKVEIVLVFAFGAIIGSFLNSVIYRLEVGKDFLRGRSFCPNCKQILGWKDLIPIFSFLILKGKCRYCKRKISLQYPLVEFFNGILFTLVFLYQPKDLIFYFVLIPFLILIFVYDLKHYLIPDKIIYPAILLSFFYRLIKGEKGLILSLLPSLFFLALILISKERWMGFGDFKLTALIGLILGWPKILVAVFFSIFLGMIVGLVLILLKKKTLKSPLPFAPFLISGCFFALFFL